MFAKPVFTRKNNFFSVLAVRRAGERGRMGVVVSKKNVRLAVMRNRLKRLVREAFRLHQAVWVGWDVVVVVRCDFISEMPDMNWGREIFSRSGS